MPPGLNGSNAQDRYAPVANQGAMTTKAAITTLHAAGVTCFELPLRGESLAALAEHR